MKLISFLGTSDYKEASYQFTERPEPLRSKFFPAAAARALQPETLLLMVTPAAYEKHYEAICDELAGVTAIEPVEIPDGRSEQEIWAIFEALTGRLVSGDEVTFDITYGFRSLPVLAIIAAAYLRVARDVVINQLLYGAYEARNEEGIAPVFDLSPFLSLMQWTLATDKFLKTGNARELVSQLRDAHSLPYRLGLPAKDKPQHLSGAASVLEEVSQGMRLLRPHTVLEAAARQDQQLSEAQSEVGRWAPPFALLLDQIRKAYQPFAVTDPAAEPKESLRAQLALIRWYVDKDQVVQAVTLAREWVVSLLILRLGWQLIDDRSFAENILNGSAQAMRQKSLLPPPVREMPGIDEMVQAWSWLGDLRNDIAHCGMRPAPRSNQTILKNVNQLLSRLEPLWEAAKEL